MAQNNKSPTIDSVFSAPQLAVEIGVTAWRIRDALKRLRTQPVARIGQIMLYPRTALPALTSELARTADRAIDRDHPALR